QTSNNEENYARNIEQAVRSLTHSISSSADLKDKKMEYNKNIRNLDIQINLNFWLKIADFFNF
uniref:Uncharacterized protein n=1 Tax=Romanomermis culicivorax TaxID=13658 RepID=A0A915L8U4_ROMCU